MPVTEPIGTRDSRKRHESREFLHTRHRRKRTGTEAGATENPPMDPNLTHEEEQFRRGVKDWLAANLPEHPEEQDTSRQDWIGPAKAWQRKVLAAGFDEAVYTKLFKNTK